jgi:tripartite-type tricarboxylate transporter receptor subunit TctC
MGLSRLGMGLTIAAGCTIPLACLATNMEVEVYPVRPIKLVVGFSPGDGADVIARELAMYMSDDLGQKVIVENRPGAVGNIGAAAAAKSTPDGYTVYLAVRPVALHKTMYKHIDYDFSRDFVPVGMVVRFPYVLVMGKHMAATSFEEAMLLAKSSSGMLTCGSSGYGSTNHLLCELLKEETGAHWEHVPFKGELPVLVELIGGRIDFAVVTVTAALPFIKSADLIALSVFGSGRVPAIPSVPAIADKGVRFNVEAHSWCAVVAPAGIPEHALDRLNHAINAALANDAIRDKLVRLGFVVPGLPNTPEMLGDFMEEDTRKWTDILESHQIFGIQ